MNDYFILAAGCLIKKNCKTKVVLGIELPVHLSSLFLSFLYVSMMFYTKLLCYIMYIKQIKKAKSCVTLNRT